jgi:hypothetical protein
MTPQERMRKALEIGWASDPLDWSRKVLQDVKGHGQLKLLALKIQLAQPGNQDSLLWAKILKQREENGEKLYWVQCQFWRRALRERPKVQ